MFSEDEARKFGSEERLKEKKITIVLDDKAKEFIIEKGYNREFGVRYLERTVEKEIVAPLGKLVLQKRINNKQISISKKDGRLGFDF